MLVSGRVLKSLVKMAPRSSCKGFLPCYHHVLQHMLYHMLAILMLPFFQVSLVIGFLAYFVHSVLGGETFDSIDISDWVSRSCLPVFPFSDLHQILSYWNTYLWWFIWMNTVLLCPYVYLQAEILRIKIVEPIWNALSIKTELPIICPLGGNNRYCNHRW